MALTHYVSAGLTKNEILAYLGELPAIFAALGFIDCVAMYGWDCNLPIDDLWQAQIVPVPALAAFIASSIEAEIFTPGASESPRVLRRLNTLRGLSHEQVEQVLTRGA